jgi:hypothetical protein
MHILTIQVIDGVLVNTNANPEAAASAVSSQSAVLVSRPPFPYTYALYYLLDGNQA